MADNAGNLYIGDSTGLQIIEEAGASSVMTTTVVTGLKSITGLSIDAGGSLYFTDSSAGQAFSYNRNVGALSFPTTNKGQTSLPLSLTLSNSGNTSLTLSTPVSTLTSGLANFTIGTGSNNGCSSAQVLTAAANCQESISFAPTTTGLLTAQASFLSSAFNTAVANFSGNAVNLIVTNASLMITSPATTPVTLGENVVVKAVITPTSSSGTMSGTVYFVVDGVAQASQPVGVGTFTIAQTFTVGTHIIGINYSGDATYAPCNSSISITVTKVPTSMVVTNTFGVGGQDTTAVVTPTTITNGAMTGTITFTVDGIAKSPISIGSGTVTGVFALADGTHIITADYSGDSTYAASTASITITVARIVTTLKLSNVLGAGGQNATLVVSPASSNGAMTGTVIFTIDGVAQSPVPIGSGSVNAVFSLADGAHTIAASYSGDGVYEPGATSINISVSRISTTTSLSVAAGAGGQAATVVVIPSNTTNGAMTGTITITIDGVAQAPVAIGSGTVTSTYVLVDGTHNLTASYSGDGVYHPSTSNSETVTVLHASTNTALNITTTANTGSAGLLLTASVTSTAKGTITGTVTFYNNGSAIGTGTVNNSGIAMLTTNKVSYTSFVFSASYGGDGNYLSSSSPNVTENADFAVVPPTTALVVAQGGQAVASISLVSVNGYSGTLTAVCGNLPANTICNFQPSTISLSPTGNTTVSLEVFSNVNPATARTTEHIQPLYLAFAIAVPLALSFLTAARKRCHGLSLLAAFVLFIVLTGIQGCSSTNAPYVTPGGTQTVTITLTDSTGLSHSGTMSLTVAAVQ